MMKKFLDILENIPGLYEGLGTLIAAVVGWLGVYANKAKKKAEASTKHAEALEESIDSLQTRMIEENKRLVTELFDRIDSITSEMRELKVLPVQVSNIHDTVVKIDAERSVKQKIDALKRRINDIGTAKVSVTKLSPEVESLIYEGCEKAAEFFARILEDDFQQMNLDTLENKAKRYLREIKLQYVIEAKIPVDMLNEIKANVAYPKLRALMYKLVTLKQGVHNGRSLEVFMNVAISFVEEFIDESLIVISKYDFK